MNKAHKLNKKWNRLRRLYKAGAANRTPQQNARLEELEKELKPNS